MEREMERNDEAGHLMIDFVTIRVHPTSERSTRASQRRRRMSPCVDGRVAYVIAQETQLSLHGHMAPPTRRWKVLDVFPST